jgi:cation transport ATPase
MDDDQLKEKLARLEEEAKERAQKESKEKSEAESEKKRLAIKRRVKNKLILWLAVIGGFLLVWQKLRIWIVIPGKFWHLLAIIAFVIGAIYFILNKISED